MQKTRGMFLATTRVRHADVALLRSPLRPRDGGIAGALAGGSALGDGFGAIKRELREGDGLYRYGGEEFVVLLPEQTLVEGARAMERVRGAVAAVRLQAGAVTEHVTISVGVAEIDTEASVARWLGRADAALYRAKRAGRNRVEVEPPQAV
jgi:diguanylate cyclase (GGDEF)-like protein